MAVVEVNDLGAIGQINDVKAHMLPPEAWTLVENLRYTGNGLEVLSGWQQVFGTPGAAPHFALPVKTSSQTFWLYTSLTEAWVYDGINHTEITRLAGDYTATATEDWNGILFGGVPILNNGADVPQYWPSYDVSVKLAALPNWPATLRTKIMRVFGSYLVAFNITDDGDFFPHLIQWSNPAAAGTVPTSWAYSNTKTEGGRKDLPDVNSGEIVEAMRLGPTMFVYKERSTWKMTYIGGVFIFSFDVFLEDVGILAPRCVCVDGTGTRHMVATQDDIILHNGNTPVSILTDKQRVTLFDSMNREAAHTCFMFANKVKEEIWFCYPEAGQDQPSRALIYNERKKAISFASGITFRNAVAGDIETASSEQWDQGTDTWAEDTGPWSFIFRYKTVLCSPANTKFYQLDLGATRDGTTYTVTLLREDLGVLGRDRRGQWMNDFKVEKMVDSLWPKVVGAPIRVRVGFRDFVDGALTWQDYTTFNHNTDMWVNTIVNEALPGSGRAFSIEFSTLTAISWRIDGYSLNVEPLGPY